MKINYTLLFLLIFSCQLMAQEHGNKHKRPAPGAVEITGEQDEATKANAEYINHGTFLKEALLKLPLKTVPLIDSTSFDSFIDIDDYKPIDADLFMLPKIYKNWHSKNYRICTINAYRLHLSENFHTVVATVLKADFEMETRLINYDLKGNIMGSQMVSYDEISEGWRRYTSTIEKKKIIRSYYMSPNEDDVPVMEVNFIKIKPNGALYEMGIDDIFFDLVADVFDIPSQRQMPELNKFKILPNNPNLAVVVVPEIAAGSEEDGYFAFNTHIALANVAAKKITHYYFESHKTNGWTSDAIRLAQISIDTAPYFVTENKRAFGLRLHFWGSSQVNPYGEQSLSLFELSGKTLKKILHNFTVEMETGEWDGDCNGEFTDHNKTLAMTGKKSGGYFDILVRNKITHTTAFKNNGDCDSRERTTVKTSILKFDGRQYQRGN
ncbi:hypothetical protein ABDK00_012010 [Niabella insulamsoli]|uniref:hypothetical protein n=1 Tax=Niabella insulamsoli TaxID=3144874 RepID=UPI0031FC1A85